MNTWRLARTGNGPSVLSRFHGGVWRPLAFVRAAVPPAPQPAGLFRVEKGGRILFVWPHTAGERTLLSEPNMRRQVSNALGVATARGMFDGLLCDHESIALEF